MTRLSAATPPISCIFKGTASTPRTQPEVLMLPMCPCVGGGGGDQVEDAGGGKGAVPAAGEGAVSDECVPLCLCLSSAALLRHSLLTWPVIPQ